MAPPFDPAMLSLIEQFYPGVSPDVVLGDQVAVNRILLESLIGIAQAMAVQTKAMVALTERVNRAAELTDLFEKFSGMFGGAVPSMPNMPMLSRD